MATAEGTPVAEAQDLQNDLRRAGIEPFGWVINATLFGSGTRDPVLHSRTTLEQAQLAHVAQVAERVWTLPWTADIATADKV